MSPTTIHVGSRATAKHSFADFLDGQTARVHRVAIRIDDSAEPTLVIEKPDGNIIDWPLDDLRLVPDQADPTRLILRPHWMEPARLLVEGKETQAIIRARCKNLSRRPSVRNRGRLFIWSVGAIASVALIIFGLVPLMADQLATRLPPGGEQALGDATFGQIRIALGDNQTAPLTICENPGGVASLASMQALIEEQTQLPYPLQVHVLDAPIVNAFALPGGHVVFFKGLIDEAQSPDEVAAVFAHEIGHVVNRDPARGALRSAGSIGVLGLIFGDFAGGTVVLFLLNRLIDASYSQEAEAGADQFAHAALGAAGIPPSSLATMFERLRQEHGDSEGIVAHFQAHPTLGDRIEGARLADKLITADIRRSLTITEWKALQGICQSGGGSVESEKNQRGS